MGVNERSSMLSAFCLSLPLILLASQANHNTILNVPALFIFGDSLVDTGNNDKLLTLAKADHLPYGKDFMGGPTGRFCNGQLAVDYLASYLGLPFPQPYLLAGDNILKGVNFASGGSGILNSTGSIFGQHIPLPQQVKDFIDIKHKLIAKLGSTMASLLINKSLYFITVGSNDYILNYFALPVGQSPLQLQYSPGEFIKLLIKQFQQNIVGLYILGARKFAVVSLPALGCVPAELFQHGSRHGECITYINKEAKSYNAALFSLLKQLKLAYPDANFVYINIYDLLEGIIKEPASFGFKVTKRTCCGLGPYGAALPCLRYIVPVCNNASEYAFWDLYHPTSAVQWLAFIQSWQGQPPQVYPFNLHDLAAL